MTITKTQWQVFLCTFELFALVSGSKFLPSLVMFLLIGSMIIDFEWSPKWRLGLSKSLGEGWRNFWKYPPFWAMWGLWIVGALSYFWSEDTQEWANFFRIKLPFLALPLVFASMPAFNRRTLYTIFTIGFWVICGSTVYVWVKYLQDFEAINAQLFQGKCLPTPINYIRYGLTLAMALLIAIQIIKDKFTIKYAWEWRLNIILGIYLLGFLHVLAVRSGIFTFYGAAAVWCVVEILKVKKYYLLGWLVVAGISLPTMAYLLLPSVQQKVAYSQYDWKMHKEGKGNDYSDSDRIRSLDIGWSIIKENPILGVGVGDLERVKDEKFAEKYPAGTIAKLPHNQFVFTWASLGLVGLLGLMLGLLVPLFYQKNYKNTLFLAFNVATFLSFMVEYTLETSIGVAFFILFELYILNYLKGEKA